MRHKRAELATHALAVRQELEDEVPPLQLHLLHGLLQRELLGGRRSNLLQSGDTRQQQFKTP